MSTEFRGRGTAIVITAMPPAADAPHVAGIARTEDGPVALTTLSRELVADIPSDIRKAAPCWELGYHSLILIMMREGGYLPVARFDSSDPRQREGLEAALRFGTSG